MIKTNEDNIFEHKHVCVQVCPIDDDHSHSHNYYYDQYEQKHHTNNIIET